MEIEDLIQHIVEEVKPVPGVRALALGGSRARGTHTASSDIDLGIYCHPGQPLDIAALSAVAARLDDRHNLDLVTPVGGWGPWINGGGWLTVDGQAVDFVYRDLAKLEGVIDDCLGGIIEIFYQPGHPHGFVTSIYAGEAAVCRPLWDPGGVLAGLKAKVTPYPQALRAAEIDKFAWEIGFSVMIAKKSIVRADVTYAAGACFRGAMCLLRVLFALNREYWLNEKGAVAQADSFALKPAAFRQRIEDVFGMLQAQTEAIRAAVEVLDGLRKEVEELVAQDV